MPAPAPLHVSDMIYAAYRLVGIISEAGRGYSQSQQSDAFAALLAMIDTWKIEDYLAYAEDRVTFVLTPPTQDYYFGQAPAPVPTVVMDRPTLLRAGGLIFTNVSPAIETPMRCLIAQEWQALSPKELTSTVPYMLYLKETVPNATLTVWPIPITAWSIALYFLRAVQRFEAVTDSIILPPGYQEAIQYNLACRLADLNPGRAKLTRRVQQMAESGLEYVKSKNAGPVLMQSELGSRGSNNRGRYNFMSNSWGS